MPSRTLQPLLAVVVAMFGACHGPAPGLPPAVVSLRVVTWNIHHGAGADGRVDAARIAAQLQALEPDVVLLQEVDVGCARSGRIDTPRQVGDHLGFGAVFAENIPFQGGSYGNAILSRWPVVAHGNERYQMLGDGERRGLLWARAATPFGTVAFGVTHLDHRPDDAERMASVEPLLLAVAREDLVAVGGDYNDLPESRVHDALCGPLVDCWTDVHGAGGASYPAEAPTKRIDWLLRRAGPWRAVAARVVPTSASDHCPVVFDLERAHDTGSERP